MVGRRVGENSAYADKSAGLLDRLADLLLLRRISTLNRVNHDHQRVIGIAAEGGNIDLVLRFEGVLIIGGDLLLRIVRRKTVGEQQSRGGQTDTFARRTRDPDKLLRGLGVCRVERQFEVELLAIASDDRRRLARAEHEQRFGIRLLHPGQKRRHIRVALAEGLVDGQC